MKKRGQSSLEYLIIVGFTITILTVLILIYFQFNQEETILVVTSQVDRIARELVDASEEVFFLGEPTRTTIKVYLPENVEDIIIDGHNIVFKVRTGKYISDIERHSSVNITGNISKNRGIKYIRVMSIGNEVCILEDGLSGC